MTRGSSGMNVTQNPSQNFIRTRESNKTIGYNSKQVKENPYSLGMDIQLLWETDHIELLIYLFLHFYSLRGEGTTEYYPLPPPTFQANELTFLQVQSTCFFKPNKQHSNFVECSISLTYFLPGIIHVLCSF